MLSSIELLNRVWGRVVMALVLLSIATACEVEDPAKEDAPELVTQVTLTFTPTSGDDDIIVTAIDPDGEGVQDIQVDTPIKLQSTKSYLLKITLLNGLIDASEPGHNITEEVEEEGDEHMFFFAWTNNIFNDPSGNGNADSRADAVNYVDEDINGLPLGLETSWTAAGVSEGNLRIVLKHQPDLKSATSDANMGETDLDITFPVEVQE